MNSDSTNSKAIVNQLAKFSPIGVTLVYNNNQ
jgi:hypothetical protein